MDEFARSLFRASVHVSFVEDCELLSSPGVALSTVNMIVAMLSSWCRTFSIQGKSRKQEYE